jgi:hypothetical protein
MSKVCEIRILLNETGCVLNEKMMLDVTVIVPELEIDRKVGQVPVQAKTGLFNKKL